MTPAFDRDSAQILVYMRRMFKHSTAISTTRGRERQSTDHSLAVPLLFATLTFTPLPASALEESPRTPATEGKLPAGAPREVDALAASGEQLAPRLVPWKTFGQYVAAYVWVSDSDFSNNTIRGLQVCGREPANDTGLTKIGNFDQSLANSAWLVVALNHSKFLEIGKHHLEEILRSPDYNILSGQARLDFARESLTARISRDREVRALVEREVQRLREISSTLTGAGIPPADPSQLLTSKARQGLQLLHDNWDKIVLAREQLKIPSDLDTPAAFGNAVVKYLRSVQVVNDGGSEALVNLWFLAERGAPMAVQLSD